MALTLAQYNPSPSQLNITPSIQIAALREELQSRAQNHVSNNTPDVTAPDYQNLMNVRRQLEKDIEVYKARLTVEERDKIKLQGQISVLDSQVKRYRGQVQSSVSSSFDNYFRKIFSYYRIDALFFVEQKFESSEYSLIFQIIEILISI